MASNEFRLSTAGGIPYKYLTTSGSADYTKTDVTEEYVIHGAHLKRFLLEMLPPSQLVNGIPVRQDRPGVPNFRLLTRRVSWEPFVEGKPIDPYGRDPSAPTGTYEPMIKVVVEYSNETTEQEEDPLDPTTFLRISASAAGEFLHVPVPGSKWAEDFYTPTANREVNRSPLVPSAITVPEIEWTVTWTRLPRDWFHDVQLARLRKAMGKVNYVATPRDDDPQGPGHGLLEFLGNPPKHTLLFVGFSMDEEFTNAAADEQPPISLEMKFVEKHIAKLDETGAPFVGNDGNPVVYGHNHFWRPGHGWQLLYVSSDRLAYEEYDFTQLFQPT